MIGQPGSPGFGGGLPFIRLYLRGSYDLINRGLLEGKNAVTDLIENPFDLYLQAGQRIKYVGICIAARRFRIILKEGKNRQIRRMVKKVGNRVVRLHRMRGGDLKLGSLASGSWRHLRPDETRRLLERLKIQMLKKHNKRTK